MRPWKSGRDRFRTEAVRNARSIGGWRGLGSRRCRTIAAAFLVPSGVEHLYLSSLVFAPPGVRRGHDIPVGKGLASPKWTIFLDFL
jgi:hypothetical protein